MADKVRVGIIGTGGIAQGHIRRLLANPNVAITALCDIRPIALEKTVERYPDLKAVPQYDDFRKMIAAGNLDAVEICTPHTTHYEQIMGSLDSGLHVLTEKPMVCTIAHAHDVLKKVEATGKTFVLNYQRSYQPEFLYIKNAIASGEYGEVQFVQGLQGQEWLRGCAGTWRHDPALSGGGQLNDSGSHMLAILLFVTGLEVDKVFGFIENLGAAVDINSALSLKFTNGAIGNISVVGNGPSWYEDITIWCSKGAFYMRNGKLEVSDAVGKRHTPTAEELPKGSNPDDNFIAAILGKEEVGSPAIWGLRVIELTEPAWKSAASGQPSAVER
ncbi:MAG TPA: Gfo/Idh/MocA family oxidoreductase [Chthonomonadaceae bacterium]|nr:Gfo/Idh/MocA family oxidoreductase [Chthonomonadaceae bacterium]